jgi:hypothetical protein
LTEIIKLTPVYDRSRVVQDWKCPRSRYWNYEFGGRGISPNGMALELFMGIVVHDVLAAIATLTQAGKPVDIKALTDAAYTQMYEGLYNPELPIDARDFAKEQATLVKGMLLGFYKHRWPQLLTQYPKILYTESEMVYEHNGLRFMSKPDLVLGNDEETVYVEYKSTSSKKDAWVNSWATAVQLHSTIRAINTTHNISVDAVIVQGLYKGYESYGKQSSPFCYAYKRNGHPPFSQDEIAYDYKAGFKRYAVWDLPGGIDKWVEEMPDVILGDQFPQTPPIYIKDDIVDRFFAQRTYREQEIADISPVLASLRLDENMEEEYTETLDRYFPQRFDQCIPSFGKPCAYQKLCHGPKVDPLEVGFQWREPHHSTETEQWDTKT